MKHLEIEWRHLEKDGETCDRCQDTGAEVRLAITNLRDDLFKCGWEIIFKETLFTDSKIAESNMILLNGIPIEEILPQVKKSENCCDSCSQLLGAPTMCRTIEYKGQTHEKIPASLIHEAVKLFINKQKP